MKDADKFELWSYRVALGLIILFLVTGVMEDHLPKIMTTICYGSEN